MTRSPSRHRWAQGLMVAILAVVCPRQILFWLSGVAGVDVPQGVLLWSDGLIGAATAIVMTGGQMYLVHHLTTLVLTAEITLWRRLLMAVLGLTWLLVVAVTVVIGSAHVVMQVARRPLLEVLEPAWIASQLPTWLVGFTTVAALELTAAGLALAHADALARAEDRDLQVVEAREDRALAERNAQLDENRRLLRRLAELEEEPRVPALVAHSGPEPAQGSNGARPPAPLVAVPCRHGCGWTSEPMPEPRARRAERAHVGHHHKDQPDQESA